MNVTITPAKLSGMVIPPPSKSQAHRVLIAAALACGEGTIDNVAYSQDIGATLDCLENLGAEFVRDGSAVTVRGMSANPMSPLRRMAYPRLNCGESGSTLRFLIPVALAVRGGGIFSGRGRLMERPQKPYFDLFDEKGIFHEQKNGVLTVAGMLTPGEYRLPGGVSSQFVTGLLYALPLLEGDSEIVLTSPLESRGYVDMTLNALGLFGIHAQARGNRFFVPGNQLYQPQDVAIEADWSQAAFWYAAQALGSPVEVGGMNPGSTQGDCDFVDWMRMIQNKPLGGGVSVPIWGPDGGAEMLTAPIGGCSVSIDVSQNPDLAPPLAAMGALMNGTLYIENAARLRLKESDRLDAIARVLGALGADVTEGPDFLTIRGRETLPGGVTVDSFNDHRIAMMAAIAATRCEKPITLTGAECVAKSYPDFWEQYERLGGKIQKVD